MGVRFFCNRCEKEIFQNITEIMKATTTIFVMDKLCVCSDCLVKELRRIELEREIEALEIIERRLEEFREFWGSS